MKKNYVLLWLLAFAIPSFTPVSAQNSSDTVSKNTQNIVITVQPLSSTVCAGSLVSFNIQATGTDLHYQWFKDGQSIPGATASVYAIPNAMATDAGSYKCEVYNFSEPAVMSVEGTLLVLPSTTITTQPTSMALCFGTTGTLSVQASGGMGATYLWYKDNVAISNATNSTYTITAFDFATATYKVAVSSFCGTAMSDVATVTVNTVPQISTINYEPEVCNGSAANMSVSATGTNLSYKWYKENTEVSSSSIFSIANAQSSDSGIYQIVVQNGCSSVYSYFNLSVPTPVAPTGNQTQSFTEGQTLADIEINGEGIKWYDSQNNAVTHQNVLNNATLLQNDNTYFATSTVSNLCESATFLPVTVQLNLGMTDFENLKFSFYPNPVTDILNFDATETIQSITIINMLGQKIFFQKTAAIKGQVNVSELTSGNYVVEAKSQNGIKKFRIVKI